MTNPSDSPDVFEAAKSERMANAATRTKNIDNIESHNENIL